ncbi:DNA alkylation repair protein [Sphingomonas sp. MAH-20]|jgi:3-methyladenine DNA glycosylase AlkD|uniref:DNA alkylation repair protein n=1 Tax=Sphingomonas horti TaxID=2682842 RepID=A0A6I4J179_9SPHN|nr:MULTISPECIES: DNA alkylation repair protein [Sphingomonas]MBA2919489.1 DNA alkylation repair protein [Sphingomonas sp. CGMCC 1.13658]MVO78369.1 DNA alkylation repair protein [Sphingomonas horti]
MSGIADQLLNELKAAADPSRAPAMQAYMKSPMPYLGVSAVPLRAVCRRVFGGLRYRSAEDWRADVMAMWHGARFREQRYAAIELTGIAAARPFQRIGSLALYEDMVLTGAWWDYVDPIATQRLWAILRNDPAPMKQAMLDWARSPDLWKRRSAILCQLHAKAATDLELLHACIGPSLDSREFFLRKAIGWALRQYARTDPREVRRYVAAHGDRLSTLSRREALKRIGAADAA